MASLILPQLLVLLLISQCSLSVLGYHRGPYDFPAEGKRVIPASIISSSSPYHSHYQKEEGDTKGIPEDDDLLLHGNYFTIHQDHAHRTLTILSSGEIKWKLGMPMLYSVFHEQVYHERSSGEHMYSLEAIATRHWICMSKKGRLYTIKQPEIFKFRNFGGRGERGRRIRHKRKKAGRRGKLMSMASSSSPPSDCLFKTFELNPKESYERPVGIYSYAHSNATHGQFLSTNPKTGRARSYRKGFRGLGRVSQVLLTQIPISYLRNMVKGTRFGKGVDYDGRVKSCILRLLSCPNHRERIQQGRKNSQQQGSHEKTKAHFYRIIERCKRRAKVSWTLPQCHSSSSIKGLHKKT